MATQKLRLPPVLVFGGGAAILFVTYFLIWRGTYPEITSVFCTLCMLVLLIWRAAKPGSSIDLAKPATLPKAILKMYRTDWVVFLFVPPLYSIVDVFNNFANVARVEKVASSLSIFFLIITSVREFLVRVKI